MDGTLWVLACLARVTVGLLLLVAGLAKMRGPRSLFVEAVLSFNLVPRRLATPFARWLPRVECGLGAALLFGVFTAWAATAAFCLIALLTSAVLVVASRGERVFCGCFGFTGTQVAKAQKTVVWRNLLLLLACMVGGGVPDPLRLELAWQPAAVVCSTHPLTAMAAVFLSLAVCTLLVRPARNKPFPPRPQGA